ncbi:Olfactory receptor 2T8-like [Phytophthora palmivora]|uniref:Olfactory receptor 2T8-like n=1 Tax=Phytophthora palmivora TaxID=4796 RepID=A0A2P4XW60_9STRA|nr:Olfactory receptor 2T8-like [Phytophthora palmivora]
MRSTLIGVSSTQNNVIACFRVHGEVNQVHTSIVFIAVRPQYFLLDESLSGTISPRLAASKSTGSSCSRPFGYRT